MSTAQRRLELDQRLDVGGVVDHDGARDGARQLDRLEQVRCATDKDRDTVSAGEVEGLEKLANALDVLTHRRLELRAAGRKVGSGKVAARYAVPRYTSEIALSPQLMASA